MNAPGNIHGDAAEIAKFEAASHRFWDVDGEFKPLHKLNPVRARYVQERCTLTGARVLDVGCGGGLLAETLSRAQARVMGIDLAPGMIETARLHALDSGLQIEYRVDSAEMLVASHAGQFDVLAETAAFKRLAGGRQSQRGDVPSDQLCAGRQRHGQAVFG